MASMIQTTGLSKRMTVPQERDPTLSDTDNERENPGKQGAKQTKPERAAADKQCKHGVAVYVLSNLIYDSQSGALPMQGHNAAQTAQAQAPALVLALPYCRLRPQSPAAQPPSPSRLAGHHRPGLVALVAEPTSAGQGCGMGSVSSVRHLGPCHYTGCMLGAIVSFMQEISQLTQ